MREIEKRIARLEERLCKPDEQNKYEHLTDEELGALLEENIGWWLELKQNPLPHSLPPSKEDKELEEKLLALLKGGE